MLISEIIKQLEQLKERHGNLIVSFRERRGTYGYFLADAHTIGYEMLTAMNENNELEMIAERIVLHSSDEQLG